MSVLSYAEPQKAGMDPERLSLLKVRLDEWCDGSYLRSGVLLAARHGKVVFHEAVGPLTHEDGASPIQRDSIFSVASVAKPITATATMILVEEGKLGLNRPITEYLPEVNGKGVEDVQVQHLLTHTSGFLDADHFVRLQEVRNAKREVGSEPQQGLHPYIRAYLERCRDLPSAWLPGSRMEYCNHNFILLSEIVRRVSGQPYDRFCRDRIFRPLGMKDTTCMRDNIKRPRIAVRGPGAVAGSLDGDSFSGMEGDFLQEAPWGFTSVGTTALDLATFGQSYLNGGTCGGVRILSPASVHEMTRNQIPGIEAHLGTMSIEASWGLGWMIQSSHRWLWANASLNPASSYYHLGSGGIGLWIDPASQTIAIFLGICMDVVNNGEDLRSPRDLFLNMVMASVLD